MTNSVQLSSGIAVTGTGTTEIFDLSGVGIGATSLAGSNNSVTNWGLIDNAGHLNGVSMTGNGVNRIDQPGPRGDEQHRLDDRRRLVDNAGTFNGLAMSGSGENAVVNRDGASITSSFTTIGGRVERRLHLGHAHQRLPEQRQRH